MKFLIQKIWLRVTSRAFVVVSLVLVIFLSKDFLIARGVEALSASGGVPLKIDHFKIDFAASQIWAKDIYVQSPKGFEDEPMLHIEYLFLNFRMLPTLFKEGLTFKNLALQLAEIRFVRNKEGAMNLNMEQLNIPLRIKKFEVVIDRVVYKDLDLPAGSIERSFNVAIREKHMDVASVDSLNDLISEIVRKAVRDQAVARLFNLNPGDFVKDNIFAAISAKRLVDKAADAVKGIVTGPEDESTTAEKTEKLETVKEELDQKINTIAEKTDQVETVKMAIDVKAEQVKELKTEIKEAKSGDLAPDEIKAKEAELKEVKADIDATKKLAEETEKELKTTEAEAADAKKEVKNLTEEIKKE